MDQLWADLILTDLENPNMLNKMIIRITLYEALWYFILYACSGWLIEEIYVFLISGELVKRGFLYGPIGPIYGFGMLIVILGLTPIKKRLIPLFAGAVLLTSLLEYFTGYVLDHIFQQKWWDYTGMPYNLDGYICLKFSLAWGALCIVIVRFIHPRVKALIEKLSRKRGRQFLIVAYSILAMDFVATLASLILKRT